MKKKENYLYVLLLPHMDEEYNLSYKVKFGYTENFKQRMKIGYEAYYGSGYQILHVYKGDFTKKDEDVIKQYLKDYTLFKNEWFRCCPEVLEFFATYNTTKKLKDKISTIPYIQPHRKYYKVNYHLVELIISKIFSDLTELLDIQNKRDEISKVLRDYTEKNQINYACDTYRITKEEIDKYLSSKRINVSEKVGKLVEEFNHYGDTTSRLKMLVRISEDESLIGSDIGAFLEMIPPKYKDYYTVVGPDRIRASGYRESDIKRELMKNSLGDGPDDKVISRMGDLFRVGHKYSRSGIKESLKKLYQELDYKKTAKATDLEVMYVMKAIKLQEDGKWVNGLEILGKR